MTIDVVKAGPATTMQGGPVRGRAHHGYSLGGAADFRALAFANAAVGNDETALRLECVLTGPSLRARDDVVVCIAGAPFPASVGGAMVPLWQPFTLAAGSVLVGTCRAGLRASIAFAGGIEGDEGARVDDASAIRLAEISGAQPSTRAVPFVAGRRPAPLSSDASGGPNRRTDAPHEYAKSRVALRVTDGPQSFSEAARAAFFGGVFIVGRASDRRGVRCAGPHVEGVGGDLVTEGASLGAVQVTPSGEPIVLGVDRCCTGGYAKIANVISVDVWRLGQLRPGAAVRFARVTFEEARALYLAERRSR